MMFKRSRTETPYQQHLCRYEGTTDKFQVHAHPQSRTIDSWLAHSRLLLGGKMARNRSKIPAMKMWPSFQVLKESVELEYSCYIYIQSTNLVRKFSTRRRSSCSRTDDLFGMGLSRQPPMTFCRVAHCQKEISVASVTRCLSDRGVLLTTKTRCLRRNRPGTF